MKDLIVYANLVNVLVNIVAIYWAIKYITKSRLRLSQLPEGLDSGIYLARKYIKTSIKMYVMGLIFMVIALCYSINILLA